MRSIARSRFSKYTYGDVRDIRITDFDMDRFEFQGYDIFMLFAVHHPPYNITNLNIELSEDGECFAVGRGLLYLLLLLLCAASALFQCI